MSFLASLNLDPFGGVRLKELVEELLRTPATFIVVVPEFASVGVCNDWIFPVRKLDPKSRFSGTVELERAASRLG